MLPQLGMWKRFIDASSTGDLEEVYWKFVRGGQMQPQLGIWKRFIVSLLVVDRCSLSWGCGRGLLEVLLVVDRCSLTWESGRGLLEVYLGWTDAASAGNLEEIY